MQLYVHVGGARLGSQITGSAYAIRRACVCTSRHRTRTTRTAKHEPITFAGVLTRRRPLKNLPVVNVVVVVVDI